MFALASSALVGAAPAGQGAASSGPFFYHPKLRVPPAFEPFLQHLEPGKDSFPAEKEAQELDARLQAFGALLRQGPARVQDVPDLFLAPGFKGGPLAGAAQPHLEGRSFEVFRSDAIPQEPVRTARAFAEELGGFVREFQAVTVAEFLITGIEVQGGAAPGARIEVRYDLVGPAAQGWRAERVGRWRMEWVRGADGGWRVASWTALEDVLSRAAAPVFSEVTDAALGANASFQRQLRWGLDTWLATIDSVFMLDSMGHHGVAVGDADGDGLDDLYVAQPAGLPGRLFRNRGDGTFQDVTEASGLGILDETSQVLFADVDNDGDQDLVLVTSMGPLLFANDGKGHFSKVADAFRFKLQGTPMSIAMADYDRDGFLDVYLCTYSYFIGTNEDKGGSPNPYHNAQNGPPSVLFHNDGHGRFVDVTDEVGLENNDRFHFAGAWADYDEDGWPDLLVANDFGRKNLYHNEGLKNGKVHFKDVAAAAGVEDYGAGMSATWLDYDNDGRLDIYTGNMWTANGRRIVGQPGFMPDAPADVREIYRRHTRGNSLFRNRGDGTFEDVTLKARAEMGRWAWCSDSFDYDNDGWDDLYVVNGMFTREQGPEDLDAFFWRQVAARSPLTRVTGTSYDDSWRVINRLLADKSQASHQRNVFMRNDGHGGFDEVSGSVGLDLDQDGRAYAVFDFDGDGDADLAVMAPRSAPQLRLFRNESPDKNASLALRLAGTKSNRDAIGAKVTVETDTLRRTKVLMAGSGFISQHSKELLFGLGKSQKVLKVTIQWPSGLSQVLTDVPLNSRLRVEEGSNALHAEAFRPSPPATAAAPPPAPVPPGSASWFYDPYPAPDFSLPDLDGAARSLSSLRGQPALLLFWSTSAPPALAALKDLASRKADLVRAGAGVLAIALDPAADAAKVRSAAQGAPGVPVALANDELGVTYALLNHYLFVMKQDLHLPTAFLLNGRGEVVKAYRDHIDVSQIVADIPKIEAPAAERLARAVPFPGTFYTAPGQRNYLQYGLELVEQGFESRALSAFERAAKGSPSAFTLYSLGTLYLKSGQLPKARAAFERSLAAKKDFAEASNGLGAVLAQSGDVPSAIVRFRAALDATPDYPEAMNNLGYALLQTSHEQEAYDLYQKALTLQPDFPEAFNNLGIFYARQGDMKQAESYFRQAVGKRPAYGEAANNLALVLMTHNASGEAIDVLQHLLAANPDFEMTYVTLAKIYLSTGQQAQGVQLLQQLLRKNPNHPLALQIMRELRGGR